MYRQLSLFFFLALMCLSQSHAQTPERKMSNPVSYENTLWSGHVAEFDFKDLGEREVWEEGKMSFFAPSKIELNFRIKIRIDGTVAYVAASPCPVSLNEYRLGGISALYGYEFAPRAESEGEQWVNVTMRVGE